MKESSEPELSPEAKRLINRRVASAIRSERRVFVGIAGAVFAITFGWFWFSLPATSKRIIDELVSSTAVKHIEAETGDVKRQVERLQTAIDSIELVDVERLHELIKAIESTSTTESLQPLLAKVATMEAEITSLQDDSEASGELLKALGESPTKALTVPLLRKDLDALKEDLDTSSKDLAQDVAQLRATITAETSRIYDLGKWFLGLILAVSVIPIIEQFYKRKKESEETKDGNADDEANAEAGT